MVVVVSHNDFEDVQVRLSERGVVILRKVISNNGSLQMLLDHGFGLQSGGSRDIQDLRMTGRGNRKSVKRLTHGRYYASLLLTDKKTVINYIGHETNPMSHVVVSQNTRTGKKNYTVNMNECVCVSDWCTFEYDGTAYYAIAVYTVRFHMENFRVEIRSGKMNQILFQTRFERLIQRVVVCEDSNLTMALLTHFTDKDGHSKGVLNLFTVIKEIKDHQNEAQF